MNMIEQGKLKSLGIKYGMRYAFARIEVVEGEVEELRTKYNMSLEDYVKMLVGIEILAIKKLKSSDRDKYLKMKEYSEIEEKGGKNE